MPLCLALCSSLVLVACGSEVPVEEELELPNVGDEKNEPAPIAESGSTICYKGRQNNNDACFSLAERSEMIDPDNDYRYLNPNTDSSFPSTYDPKLYAVPFRFVDLESASARLWLGEFFQAEEFMATRKGRYGLFSREVVHRLDEMRGRVGGPIFINSAYRSPGYNAGINGSARWSRHQYGDAIDFYSGSASLSELQEHCRDLGASFTRVYTTHIHCDWRGQGVDPIFLDSNQPLLSSRFAVLPRIDHSHEDFSDVERVTWKLDPEDASKLVFYFEQKYQEDDAEVVISWNITSPSGANYSGTSSELVLPHEPGTYLVDADIGGTYQINRLGVTVW